MTEDATPGPKLIEGMAFTELKALETLSAEDVWAKVFTWGPIVVGDIAAIVLSLKLGGGAAETFGFVAAFTAGALMKHGLGYLADAWASLKKQAKS